MAQFEQYKNTRHVIRCANNKDVHAVFEDLFYLEREEEKALTRAVNSLWEL